MARAKKEIQIWTIRNTSGQFLATYYGYTAEQAINRFLSEVNSHCNAFRKSGTRFVGNVTAMVEKRT